MKSNIFSNCLIYMDLNAHYVPILGTTVALCGILEKYMFLPALNKETISANHYLSHISNKSLSVFLLESIPVLGSVFIYLGTRKPNSLLLAIPGLLQRLPTLQKDKEVILKMVNNRSWEAMKYAHPDLQNDQEILTNVLDSAPWEKVKHLLPHEIIADKELMLKALRCISPERITDKKRILKALEVSWEAIKYAHPDLQNDQEILTNVLDSAPWEKVKHLLPHEIITDKELMLKALRCISPERITDKKRILKALEVSWEVIKYAHPNLIKDQEILTNVLDSAPWEKVKHLLPHGIITDKERALKILNRSWENVKYISKDVLCKDVEVYEKILDEAPWEVIRDLLFPRIIPGVKSSALKALNRSWEAVKYISKDVLCKDVEVYEKILDEAPWEVIRDLLFPRIIPGVKSSALKALNRSWEAVKYISKDVLCKDVEVYEKILDEAPWEVIRDLLFPRIIPGVKSSALKALNRSWEAVKYISKDVLCKDVEVYEKILDEAPWEVIRDLLFPRIIPGVKSSALKALNRSWEAIKYIRNQGLLSDEEFALQAIKIHPLVLPYISKNLISDDRFLHSVVVQKPLAKTSSGEMAIASMINLNGLHLAPPLLSCPKDVQSNVRDLLTEFDKNIADKSIYRDAGNLQLSSQRDSLEKLCNKVQNTSNDLLFTQLSLLLKNIIYQWKTGKGLEKKDQHLRALADAASKCTPTWLEVTTRIYSELDGSGTPEAELLTLVQQYKEETILQFTQVNARHWHSLNYIRKRYGTDLGLNTTLARHDMYTNDFPSSLTKWQIKALWDARSLLKSVHTALSTQEYSIPLYNFLKQITEKNHLAKDKDSIVDYVSDNFYNEDYTLNLHAVHVMLIDIGVLEKVV